MPNTTAVVVKAFAALLATGLGTLGGFNYVNGGNVLGTGNDYPDLAPTTSISSVAAGYTTPRAQTKAQTEAQINTAATPAEADPENPESAQTQDGSEDDSCCVSTGRAGFLTTPPADAEAVVPSSLSEESASEG